MEAAARLTKIANKTIVSVSFAISFNWYIDSIEAYDCYVKPINWKGAKAVMVSLNNAMEQKLKQKLWINQSNEISTQFHDVINTLEDQIAKEDDRSNSSKKQVDLNESFYY